MRTRQTLRSPGREATPLAELTPVACPAKCEASLKLDGAVYRAHEEAARAQATQEQAAQLAEQVTSLRAQLSEADRASARKARLVEALQADLERLRSGRERRGEQARWTAFAFGLMVTVAGGALVALSLAGALSSAWGLVALGLGLLTCLGVWIANNRRPAPDDLDLTQQLPVEDWQTVTVGVGPREG